jgi:hypothetical protein
MFRQINKDNMHTHHDALEFPDGQMVLALHNFQRPPMDARAWGVAVIGASFSGSCCRIS